MDEQKIKSLLETAGREYNLGKYAEAIAHWQEILTIDPGNQKAKEGIRMAQLLVVNWEASETESDEGPALLQAGGTDGETKEKIDVGIARVRELMAAGRHQEALEGCQLLAELAPGMESVRQLREEVTQAHEAQPFLKDRLERAKRFLAQGKIKEAAEEARNVLSVDRTNQQAQVILDRATGGLSSDVKTKAPSAFQVDGGGKAPPPSPFAGRTTGGDTDALLAQFEFESEEPTAAAGPHSPAAGAPRGEAPAGRSDLHPAAPAGPIAPPRTESEAKIRSFIAEGEKLFAQKKYQPAIEVWSRVFALDETHAQAGTLIDRAKAMIEDQSRQADEAYFRGVDALESGNLAEARKSLEQVLAINPGHEDAETYLRQVKERMAAGPKTSAPSPPLSPSPAAAAATSKASPLPHPSRADQEAATLDSSSVPLAVSPEDLPRSFSKSSPGSGAGPMAPVSSAGVMKKKPVIASVRKSPLPLIVGGGLAALLLLAVGAAYFLLRGGDAPSSPIEPAQAAVVEGTAPEKRPKTPVVEVLPGPPPSKSGGKTGSLEVVPGNPPPPPDDGASDPAATRRKIDALMKEGRGLFKDQKFAEAVDRFDQVLALDPTSFDALEMKTKAAAEAQKEAKFNKEIDSAKAAFADGDWAGSLYKLYRLREERKDMTILMRYIRNANYNWGIESLSGFEVDNALDHFKDAIEMAPGDAAIQRNIDFAGRYRRHSRDAAFDAFVKSLKQKALDD